MYLIIKDPTARTVVMMPKEELTVKQIYWYESMRMLPLFLFLSKESAEETAKSIAIKENLCFTPSPSY